LTAANKRVATLKKARHAPDLQPAGKDSARMRAAGAAPVYLLGAGELITIEAIDDTASMWARIAAANAGCDFFLLEGLRPSGVPLIEVLGSAPEQVLKFQPGLLSAVVGDRDPGCAVPFFKRSDTDGIARFMEAYHG
jgi:molybdopterin-guanine dinucleotide biosynthesis adapter protein